MPPVSARSATPSPPAQGLNPLRGCAVSARPGVGSARPSSTATRSGGTARLYADLPVLPSSAYGHCDPQLLLWQVAQALSSFTAVLPSHWEHLLDTQLLNCVGSVMPEQPVAMQL